MVVIMIAIVVVAVLLVHGIVASGDGKRRQDQIARQAGISTQARGEVRQSAEPLLASLHRYLAPGGTSSIYPFLATDGPLVPRMLHRDATDRTSPMGAAFQNAYAATTAR